MQQFLRDEPQLALTLLTSTSGHYQHRYLGLVRVVTVRRPRIGLLAVRAEERRRGIGRALLAHALEAAHRAGFAEAWTEVQESNHAAAALFEGVGARPVSSNLELVR